MFFIAWTGALDCLTMPVYAEGRSSKTLAGGVSTRLGFLLDSLSLDFPILSGAISSSGRSRAVELLGKL